MASAEVQQKFKELADRFGWEPVVVEWMIKPDGLGARSINDFVFAIAKPEEMEAIATAAKATNKLLATSRLR